jgi:hypothetical protein
VNQIARKDTWIPIDLNRRASRREIALLLNPWMVYVEFAAVLIVALGVLLVMAADSVW